jgi:allantoicase
MDNQSIFQKRKRAETIDNTAIILDAGDTEETIVVDTSRYGLPSIKEDNLEDSDVDQPDEEPLEKSTLFWSTQLVIKRQEDDEMGLGKPSAKH